MQFIGTKCMVTFIRGAVGGDCSMVVMLLHIQGEQERMIAKRMCNRARTNQDETPSETSGDAKAAVVYYFSGEIAHAKGMDGV
jgi:hypothetical protein